MEGKVAKLSVTLHDALARCCALAWVMQVILSLALEPR